jgi:Domain of unknown function (DUF4920)
MFKQFFIPLSIGAILAVSCTKSAQTTALSTKETSAVVSKSANAGGNAFGEKISAKGAVTYDALRSKMGNSAQLENVKVSGTIETVCQAKGCWMKISSANGAPSMHVQFKDYAFFMPKNIAGKTVVMAGKAVKQVTSVEELRHFAEDAGKSKEDIAKITQPKEEIQFVASGVLILK